MNSWDCFDTLIARRYFNPTTIFDEVGRRVGDSNFTQKRISAEKKSKIKSYEEIYKRLPGIDPNVELQVELEHNYPIVENIQKVKDGDLIISDIYHSKDFVEKLLRKCGLTKDVKIITTSDGKKKGWIWNTLIEKSLIECHHGDNFKSDVEMPRLYGVQTIFTDQTFFNQIEKEVSEKDYHLACWMRYVRLSCPYSEAHEKAIWFDQADINLPVLALASLELPEKPIAFTMRDCVYWKPLYESITGRNSVELYSSRLCYKNPSPEYSKYVYEVTRDKIIVDLIGSGRSIKEFFKQIPEVIYLAISDVKEPFVPYLAKAYTAGLEQHNISSTLLPLINYGKNGPIFGDYERDKKIAQIQESAMKIAISSNKFFSIKQNLDLLQRLLNLMDNDYTTKNVSWSGKMRTK